MNASEKAHLYVAIVGIIALAAMALAKVAPGDEVTWIIGAMLSPSAVRAFVRPQVKEGDRDGGS